MSRIATTISAAAIVLSSNAYAVNPNSGQTSTSQTLNIEITSPTANASVDLTSALSVEGRVNIGAVPSSGRSNVAYVIDVSGSTDDTTDNDCNNDGRVDGGDNFTPADSSEGTILDCEIGAVMALNDSLGSNGSVAAAVVLFGTSAATAQDFVTPPNNDASGNGIPDIEDTLVQTDQGGGAVDVGFTTDFNDALTEVTRLMNTRPASEQRVVYFLTDGQNSSNITTTATAARDANIRIETFSVGNGAATCAGSTLGEIAQITGGTCTDVQDVNTLSAVISNTGGVPPTGIERVTVSLNGGAANDASVDNLGNWSSTVAASELANGANTLEATVIAQDGTNVIADLTFNALDGTTPVTPDPVPTPEPTPTPTPDPLPVANDPTTPTNGPGTTIYCASAASDTDGDGWGYENNQSCVVAPMGMPGPMYCMMGSATDADGDGWGWENNASCLVQGSAFDLARTVCPACVDKDSDPDGDGWGWENNATCVVPGSAASMLVD